MVIDSFDDKPSGGLSVIEAGIIVNRDSQKAIIIGRAGVKLKELGSVAREKLEQVITRDGSCLIFLFAGNLWCVWM